MDTKRIAWLDGVRGLAAFAVAFGHLLSTQSLGWPKTMLSYTNYPMINIFWNGPAAVSIFFVLSGYVLSLGVRKNMPLKGYWFRGFVISRITRIALPFWGAILLSLVLFYTVYNGTYWATLHDNWLSKEWGNILLTSSDFIQQVLLVLPNTEHTLVPQGWTLTIELQISLFIPLMYVALVRSPYFSAIVILAIGMLLHQTFMVHFLLGVLLAVYQHHISDFIERCSQPIKWMVFFTGFILLTWVWHPEGKVFEVLRWVTNGLGAMIVIAIGDHLSPIVNIFKSTPFLFLGRISYSFYLTHLAVYLTLFPYVSHWPQTMMLLIMLWAALLCATIFYYLIELPSINIGHQLKKQVIS
jgi:peptidoglycan/LPS O-acetylase OafA/YrhL